MYIHEGKIGKIPSWYIKIIIGHLKQVVPIKKNCSFPFSLDSKYISVQICEKNIFFKKSAFNSF